MLKNGGYVRTYIHAHYKWETKTVLKNNYNFLIFHIYITFDPVKIFWKSYYLNILQIYLHAWVKNGSDRIANTLARNDQILILICFQFIRYWIEKIIMCVY